MGTPPQDFQLILTDITTGPLVAEQCCVACCHMHWYDPHKSTTYHSGYPFGGPLGCLLGDGTDGSTDRCYQFRESIQIIGDSTLSLRYNFSKTVQKSPAEITFARQPFDGFLGLDLDDGSSHFGIVNTAYALGLLKAPVYTVNFQRTCADGIAGNAGVITYGEADTTHCDANTVYPDPDGSGDTKFTELRLGNLKLTPRNGLNYWPLVSTSYTEPNILVATEDPDPSDEHPKPQPLDQILAELNAVKEDATGLYTVDCSSVTTFTDLTLVINGVTYAVPSSEYTYRSSANGKCYVRFGYRKNQGGKRWVLGLPFLHRQV
ncbi:aspartic protease [Aphelenchoides avenae]|nr:aspartic protease [Aphelenchus avenae]